MSSGMSSRRLGVVRGVVLGSLCCLSLILCCGCLGPAGEVVQTGPKAAGQVADIAKTLALQAVDGLSPTGGSSSVDARLNDPRYRVVGMAGPVWLVDLELSLTGVDLEGELAAKLEKRAEADPELRKAMLDLLRNTELSAQEKESKLLQLLDDLLKNLQKPE